MSAFVKHFYYQEFLSNKKINVSKNVFIMFFVEL